MPDVRLKRVDVVTNPITALREGVRMIPAIKEGDRLLSGVMLGEQAIRDFLQGNGKENQA
jgi:uncharacterized protein (UPF0210 family)